MKKEKLRIFIDMDGVLVDYRHPKDSIEHKKGAFLEFPPIEGAIDAVKQICKQDHLEVFFASTAPWSCTSAWTEKREWMEKYLPSESYKKLILIPRKDFLIGDILIDDRPVNGAKEFKGKWLQFGSKKFPDWRSILNYLNIE